MHFSGCAGLLGGFLANEASLAEHYRTRAVECEKSGELQRALLNWKVVGELNPEDGQAAEKVAGLRAEILSKSDIHFKRAVHAYKKGSFETARKEFLITLRYNPNHQKAIEYLNDTWAWQGHTTYKVKKDDTFKDIARTVYKDSEKDFLVAYFMGLDTRKRPPKGAVIRLPVLEPELAEQLMDVVGRLTEARDTFGDKDYEKVLEITGEILEYDSENKEATALKNAAYYQLGKKLKMKRKYLEAMKMFKQVDPDYEDIRESISAVQESLIKQAEIHYQSGVKHFVNEDLEAAIAEWERALMLNPEHEKARENIENARELLEKWKQIK